MRNSIAFDRLQKKGSSAGEDGNKGGEANSVRANLDGLDGHDRGSTLGTRARA